MFSILFFIRKNNRIYIVDVIKKSQLVLENKISFVPIEVSDVRYFIVYFIFQESIIYIGKTTNVSLYILKKQDFFQFDSYYFEETFGDIIDDILAELILNFQPLHNANMPANTKFISSSIAKSKYRIDLKQFKKVFKEHGGIQYRTALYIEKQIFDDIFGLVPYHPNMPKLHSRIILKKDYLQAPESGMKSGFAYQTLYESDGNPVDALVQQRSDYKQHYEHIMFLINHEYIVTKLLDSENFEACCYGKKLKIRLNANNYETNYGEIQHKDAWIKGINEYDLIRVAKNIERENIEKQ